MPTMYIKPVFKLDKENDFPSMEGPKYPIIDNLIIHTRAVENLLNTLEVNKALGPDDLPVYILRETTSPDVDSHVQPIIDDRHII